MTRRHTPPWAYLLLMLPFGIMNGYLVVTLAWQLAHAHIGLPAIAALIAASYIPHTWKFLWSPLGDTTLTSRRWYVIGAVTSAIGITLTGMIPMTAASMGLLTIVVVVSNFAVTLLGMALESMLAHTTREDMKGSAGGWYQAGNLGGSGLGGGAGLWLAQNVHQPYLPGLTLGVICLGCCAALPFVGDAAAAVRGRFVPEIRGVVRDLWTVARSRLGILGLILCLFPIGSGAASNLWSAVAGDWHASANTVALVTGVGSGLLSAFGCLVGGLWCDRMDRKSAYMLFGVMQAACAVGMGFLPHTERMYVVMTSLYAVVTGLTYAGFTAFTLEAIGLGAAATKYSVFASLSNTPIALMTSLDGWAHEKYGPAGMLYTEAAVSMAGLVLYLVVLLIAKRVGRPAAEPATPA